MTKTYETAEHMALPLIALNGIVLFPRISVSFEIHDSKYLRVCEQAADQNAMLFFVTRKESDEKTASDSDSYYSVGVVGKIQQLLKISDDSARVIVEPLARAEITQLHLSDAFDSADVVCKQYAIEENGGVRGEALVLDVLNALDSFAHFLPKLSSELLAMIRSVKEPGFLSDLIGAHILVRDTDKQAVLEQFDPLKRLELVDLLLQKEEELLQLEWDVHKRVKNRINQNQREYYLREQLKVIQQELAHGQNYDGGDEDEEYFEGEDGDEIAEYMERINKACAGAPEEIKQKLVKETKRMAKMPYGSAESGILRNYLDTCLEYPWTTQTEDCVDVARSREILNHDHDGMKEIKDRILEYLAVKQRNPSLNNQILCLVGPPGVGKTSICASIAKAMGRKYVRMSLGGVRDEADIRGHRKTYIGAMPGRVVNAIIQAKVNNPLIVLDELDKLTRDAHGDPASALLEVLDSEQNCNFRDHFMELPTDLSNCVFSATANTLQTIPRPLLDRVEVIEMHTYTRMEKCRIAKHHLIPKQRKRHGLDASSLQITDGALERIIDGYTRESGVRELERLIAKVCRKAAMQLLETKEACCHVRKSNVHEFLGQRKFLPDLIDRTDEIGVVNGLAYTESGGEMLQVEACAMTGSGKLDLTGSLGDVMKESAHAAISYIRAHCSTWHIAPDFYKNRDIHIHVPEGAVPKDGPSAGVTMTTALISELSGRPVRHDVAMTGEITLHGRVLPIGGLREKTMAAYRAGIKTVCIPKNNEPDLEEIDPTVRAHLHFVPCERVDDVLREALI